jgi:hypothetical protein
VFPWYFYRIMKKLVVLTAIAAVVAIPRPASAWGFEAHRYITERVIALLPAPIRPFFLAYRISIVEHTIDPDLWRNAGWEAEPPRHYVDMDSYGPYPFKELPRSFDEAVRRFGREFVEKNGLLPWRTEEMYGKLAEAFTQKSPYSRDNIKFFASVVSHYVADAHVPFHATSNYDGQLTGQWGIHARFEADLFERYRDRLNVVPKPLVPVVNVRDLAFDSLSAAYLNVQPILDADKGAVSGRTVYDDTYYRIMIGRVKPILERQLAESITDVASVITAAWVQAGRPALPLDQPRPPKKVRRE